jgi:hypothetical protein
VMPRSTALAPRSAPSRFKEDGGQTSSQILLGQGDDMDQRMKQIVKLFGGWATTLKNMKVNGTDYAYIVENKKCLKPPTR